MFGNLPRFPKIDWNLFIYRVAHDVTEIDSDWFQKGDTFNINCSEINLRKFLM